VWTNRCHLKSGILSSTASDCCDSGLRTECDVPDNSIQKVLEVASINPDCPPGTIEVDVNIYTRTWAYEIDWFLSQHCQNHNNNYLNYRPYYHHCCVPDRDLQLTCTDSYGDGWHGAKLTINGKQFCHQMSAYGMHGRRSLGIPGGQWQDLVSKGDLHNRNLLSDPIEYAWVMSKWAWMIYNDKLFAESHQEQGFWTHGSKSDKNIDLLNSGFQLVNRQELYVGNYRYIGGAYIYNTAGSFRHWSRRIGGKIGVISMCGTEPTNLADWYADFSSLWCEKLDFDTGSTWRAGYGFAKRFNDVKLGVNQAIQMFRNYHIVDIYVTGHSLGGAMASIVAAYLKQGINIINWSPSVNLVTFGSPRTFCAADADRLQTLTDLNDGTFTTMRIVNYNDVVTDVPFRHPMGLKHFGKVYTMDSRSLAPLQPQVQDYEANHWGKNFLTIVDNALIISFPLFATAQLAWGAVFSHGEYPELLDKFHHCQRVPTACSRRRLNSIPTRNECVYSSRPVQLPPSCASAGKLTRFTVNPANLPRISTTPGTKRFIMVANDRVCYTSPWKVVVSNTYSPHACAPAILQDKDGTLCPSGFFAVAPGTNNHCICCDAGVAWQYSPVWKIYKVRQADGNF